MSHCSTGRDDRPRDLFATGRSRSTSAAIVRSMFGPGTSNATHSSSRLRYFARSGGSGHGQTCAAPPGGSIGVKNMSALGLLLP